MNSPFSVLPRASCSQCHLFPGPSFPSSSCFHPNLNPIPRSTPTHNPLQPWPSNIHALAAAKECTCQAASLSVITTETGVPGSWNEGQANQPMLVFLSSISRWTISGIPYLACPHSSHETVSVHLPPRPLTTMRMSHSLHKPLCQQLRLLVCQPTVRGRQLLRPATCSSTVLHRIMFGLTVPTVSR